MSTPPPSPPIEELTGRPFSFYPPILAIEHNEWMFQKATWSEVLVRNTKNGPEIWIPRRFLGEVSRIDEPVMIVGLNRELEYKAGSIWPHERRVLTMPGGGEARSSVAAPNEELASPELAASVRRRKSSPELKVGKLIGALVVAGVGVLFLVVGLNSTGVLQPTAVVTARDQSYLGLTKADDYHAVVRKLGKPSEDRWKADSKELQYRVLWYKERDFNVVLLGTDRGKEFYIGTLSGDWKPLHFVEYSKGNSTLSMLRTLKRF
jgi:hypothetical protein